MTTGDTRRSRVLVVDENPDECELYAMALARHGHDVILVPDRGEASERLRAEAFDVAIVDISRDGVEGWVVIRDLRSDGRAPPYFIAVSSHAGPAHEAAAREAGFAEHHVKPFSALDLAERITQVTERLKIT